MSIYNADGERLPNLLSFQQVVSSEVMETIRRITRENPLTTYETAISELLELGAKSYKRKYGSAKR